MVTTPYMVSKASALVFGILFFGGPILDSKLLQWLDLKKYVSHHTNPSTYILTQPSTLFHNVPTNAQLTLRLLREAESVGSPIPPPPLIRGSPPTSPIPLTEDILASTGDDLPFGATPEELANATASDPSIVQQTGGQDFEVVRTTPNGGHRSSRVTEAMRNGIKAAVKIGIVVDKVKARAGNTNAQSRQGTLERPGERPVPNAERYDARYEGKKGYVYLMGGTVEKPAMVSFITGPPLERPSTRVSAKGHSDLQVLWSLEVRDVVKLVKHSGYGPTPVNSKVMRYVVWW